MGDGPGRHKESDTTEQLTHILLSFPSSQLVSWSCVWSAANRLSIKGALLLLALRLAAGRPSWALRTEVVSAEPSPQEKHVCAISSLGLSLWPSGLAPPPLCCWSLQRACLRGPGTAPPAWPWARPGDRRLLHEAQTLECGRGTTCLFSDWWLGWVCRLGRFILYFLISMSRKIVCIWARVYVFLKDMSYFYRQTQTVIVNPIRRRSSSRMSLVRKKENYNCLVLF